MNYYNPYYGFIPYSTVAPARTGLIGSLIGRGSSINWGSILNNTQRVLGIANQAIPMIRQMGPVVKNAKTMFQVMNEFKKVESPSSNKYETVSEQNAKDTMDTINIPNSSNSIPNSDHSFVNSNAGPTFFA